MTGVGATAALRGTAEIGLAVFLFELDLRSIRLAMLASIPRRANSHPKPEYRLLNKRSRDRNNRKPLEEK